MGVFPFLSPILHHACPSSPLPRGGYFEPLRSALASPSIHTRNSNERYGRCHCQWTDVTERDKCLTVVCQLEHPVSSVQFQASTAGLGGLWAIVVLGHGVAQNWGTSDIKHLYAVQVTFGQFRETERASHEQCGNLPSCCARIYPHLHPNRPTLCRLHFQPSFQALIHLYLVPTPLVKPLRRYHTRLWAEIAMAPSRYVRG